MLLILIFLQFGWVWKFVLAEFPHAGLYKFPTNLHRVNYASCGQSGQLENCFAFFDFNDVRKKCFSPTPLQNNNDLPPSMFTLHNFAFFLLSLASKL